MNESKPLKKCRENAQSVETIGLLLPEEQGMAETCFTGYVADGIKGA
jgi:hypothetical protein